MRGEVKFVSEHAVKHAGEERFVSGRAAKHAGKRKICIRTRRQACRGRNIRIAFMLAVRPEKTRPALAPAITRKTKGGAVTSQRQSTTQVRNSRAATSEASPARKCGGIKEGKSKSPSGDDRNNRDTASAAPVV